MLHSVQSLVLLVLGGFALWGAYDYIVESVRIFRRSMQRYRDRNRD